MASAHYSFCTSLCLRVPPRVPHVRHAGASGPGGVAQHKRAAGAVRASAQERGGGLDDLEVAVFRFTLGIPGFDDALIPRVVGVAGAAALAANHFLSGSVPSDAQVRAEALGGLLAAVAFITPTIEQMMKERRPGRGRQAASEAVEGATRVFALHSGLPDSAKQEAAWASFALLRNSNICGLVVLWDGRAVMCRGLVGLPPGVAAPAGGDADAVLDGMTQAFQSAAPPLNAAYWPDRGSIRGGWGASLPCVPAGAQAVLVQPIQPLPAAVQDAATGSRQAGLGGSAASGEAAPACTGSSSASSAHGGRGWLLLISERPRALSASERAWAAAVAGKLWSTLARAGAS